MLSIITRHTRRQRSELYSPSLSSWRISFVRWKLISSKSCCSADCGRSNVEPDNAMFAR